METEEHLAVGTQIVRESHCVPMGVDQHNVEASLLEFPALAKLLGGVIRERLLAENPECFLLTFLGHRNISLLRWWEQQSHTYLRAVESADGAVAKLCNELAGPARVNTPQSFNGRLGDALAEISAVCELSKSGYSRFERLVPRQISKKRTESAADYRCLLPPGGGNGVAAQCAYLEVKNMRAPIGIVDIFDQAYRDLAKSTPNLLNRRFTLSYDSDNTATEHVETITDIRPGVKAFCIFTCGARSAFKRLVSAWGWR